MKSCCICFSLRTGGIIIGIIDLIGGILGAIGAAIFICVFVVASKTSLLNLDPENAVTQRPSFWEISSTTEMTVTTITSETNEIDEEKQKYFATILLLVMTISFYILLVLCIVQIIVGSFLLYGIRKESPSFMKVWLVFKTVFLIISIFVFLLTTCAWGLQPRIVLQQILSVALNVYFIKAIYDLRKEISEQINGNAHASYSAKA